MYLTKKIKEESYTQHGEKTNTIKAEAQIARFTNRITD